jgi:hypothetical protein
MYPLAILAGLTAFGESYVAGKVQQKEQKRGRLADYTNTLMRLATELGEKEDIGKVAEHLGTTYGIKPEEARGAISMAEKIFELGSSARLGNVEKDIDAMITTEKVTTASGLRVMADNLSKRNRVPIEEVNKIIESYITRKETPTMPSIPEGEIWRSEYFPELPPLVAPPLTPPPTSREEIWTPTSEEIRRVKAIQETFALTDEQALQLFGVKPTKPEGVNIQYKVDEKGNKTMVVIDKATGEIIREEPAGVAEKIITSPADLTKAKAEERKEETKVLRKTAGDWANQQDKFLGDLRPTLDDQTFSNLKAMVDDVRARNWKSAEELGRAFEEFNKLLGRLTEVRKGGILGIGGKTRKTLPGTEKITPEQKKYIFEGR